MEDVLGQSRAPSGCKSRRNNILNQMGTASLKCSVISLVFGFFFLTFILAALIDIFLNNGSDDRVWKRLMRPTRDRKRWLRSFLEPGTVTSVAAVRWKERPDSRWLLIFRTVCSRQPKMDEASVDLGLFSGRHCAFLESSSLFHQDQGRGLGPGTFSHHSSPSH